jgi:hypothetical protein
MAKRLGEEHLGLLFIRSADWEHDHDLVIKEKVKHDMVMQQDWHMLMMLMLSTLKFRQPGERFRWRCVSACVGTNHND